MASATPEDGLRANQEVFSETLLALAESDPNLLVVTSDSRGSGKLVPFGKRLPRQIVEVGIAEQSLVGVSAGLASAGKRVFAVSPACFLSARSLEQIKNDICYSDFPVVLTGISAGVSYGALGSTHHSLHDFAVMRTLENIVVVAPADARETDQLVRRAAEATHPVYMRLGKFGVPTLHQPDTSVEFGRAIPVVEGKHLVFVATGEMVWRAVEAAAMLRRRGIEAGVISMHTIHPLDASALQEAARSTGAVITVEEHSVHGGLGEACATTLLESGLSCRFRRMGLPDGHTETGSQDEILRHYRMDGQGLAEAAETLLGE